MTTKLKFYRTEKFTMGNKFNFRIHKLGLQNHIIIITASYRHSLLVLRVY